MSETSAHERWAEDRRQQIEERLAAADSLAEERFELDRWSERVARFLARDVSSSEAVRFRALADASATSELEQKRRFLSALAGAIVRDGAEYYEEWRASRPALSPAELEADRKLLRQIAKLLPADGPAARMILGHFNFGFSFASNDLAELKSLQVFARQGDCHFADAVMNDALEELVASAQAFTNAIGQYTYTLDAGFVGVPQEWDLDDPARFNKAVKQLNARANGVEAALLDLMKLGKQRLGIAYDAQSSDPAPAVVQNIHIGDHAQIGTINQVSASSISDSFKTSK